MTVLVRPPVASQDNLRENLWSRLQKRRSVLLKCPLCLDSDQSRRAAK
jgi:hypothetical protein